MTMLEKLAYLWNTPNAFRNDWRKYGVNQIGHGLIGIVGGLLTYAAGYSGIGWLAAFLGALCLIGYALWELSQWQFRRASASDCYEDWAFFYSGFLVGLYLFWPLLAAMSAHLAGGIFWRVEENLASSNTPRQAKE